MQIEDNLLEAKKEVLATREPLAKVVELLKLPKAPGDPAYELGGGLYSSCVAPMNAGLDAAHNDGSLGRDSHEGAGHERAQHGRGGHAMRVEAGARRAHERDEACSHHLGHISYELRTAE